MMNRVLVVTLVSTIWSLVLSDCEIVEIKTAAKPAAEGNNENSSLASVDANNGNGNNNGSTPCDRYLRSAEVEVRNPRNHKFVTSNGWERQRPRPEISVYSRIEEQPQPQPQLQPQPATTYYQQHHHQDTYYHNSRQQPQPVRTSKRIIYYATLPDVVRPNYPAPSGGYTSDPYALGPGPFSADFRQLDLNRPDGSQRNRLAPYENAYNRGNGLTSVTSTSSAVYNSRYDEPAEFRDSYYRPNSDFTSKFASWSEPFYKGFSWDKGPSTSWDRDRVGGGAAWEREPLNRGAVWEIKEPFNNRGSSSWDKELVEVPLQKPGRANGDVDDRDKFPENKYPEVAVVHSGVIDVRGDRNGPPPAAPPPRFTIIDVDPKPYQAPPERYEERVPQSAVDRTRYDPITPPARHDAYRPMQPARFEQQQPPSSTRYEQQPYRAPPPPPPQSSFSSSSSSSTRYGPKQNSNKQQPSNGYYESIKNNINTHQFMTSWTEVTTQDEVSPTHSVIIDVSSLGNSTNMQNNTRITPYTNTNNTKIPK